MVVSETDLDELIVATPQLAGVLDVYTKHVAELTRRGILEPLKQPNGTAVRGRYPLIANVQAFTRYVRTEKTKATPTVADAALKAARLRKFQAEAILRTIAAAERKGECVPLKGVRDLLARMIHRCRRKLLLIPARIAREFGEEASEVVDELLAEAMSELRRMSHDDFLAGSKHSKRNGATEETPAALG
jgi:phage terminase Nu1 subunit (DNA packaging protein)